MNPSSDELREMIKKLEYQAAHHPLKSIWKWRLKPIVRNNPAKKYLPEVERLLKRNSNGMMGVYGKGERD